MKKIRLRSRLRRAFQGSSRGFSLIEVSIAIVLIGVIVVAILGSLSYASTVLIITDRQATAESLAKSQMEYVKNQEYKEAPPGGVATYAKISEITDIPYGYSICGLNRTGEEPFADVVGIPWSSGNSTDPYYDNGLQKVTVIITYEILRPENKIVQEQFILVGYKRQSGVQTEV